MKLTIILVNSLLMASIFAQQTVSMTTNDKAKIQLQSRLNKIKQLNAHFIQKVHQNGSFIQESKGELWLMRPNLFRWQIAEPDPLSIISDGKTIWYYTPEINQVTLMSASNSDNTQLLQILTDKDSDSAFWQNYSIAQKQDQFYLNPKDKTELRFELTILETGKLTHMTMIESDDQTTTYQLSGQNIQNIPLSRFNFKLPQNVTIDDQR